MDLGIQTVGKKSQRNQVKHRIEKTIIPVITTARHFSAGGMNPLPCRRRVGVQAVLRPLRDFGDMPGKLHGLPKKVLKLTVIIAYCQIPPVMHQKTHRRAYAPRSLLLRLLFVSQNHPTLPAAKRFRAVVPESMPTIWASP